MEVEFIIVMDITMMVMGISLAAAMIMGAMCIIIVNVDLQAAGQRTLPVESTLVVEGMLVAGEVEGDKKYI
jgi:hypothetical protein